MTTVGSSQAGDNGHQPLQIAAAAGAAKGDAEAVLRQGVLLLVGATPSQLQGPTRHATADVFVTALSCVSSPGPSPGPSPSPYIANIMVGSPDLVLVGATRSRLQQSTGHAVANVCVKALSCDPLSRSLPRYLQ